MNPEFEQIFVHMIHYLAEFVRNLEWLSTDIETNFICPHSTCAVIKVD